jgi:hypothetical protein
MLGPYRHDSCNLESPNHQWQHEKVLEAYNFRTKKKGKEKIKSSVLDNFHTQKRISTDVYSPTILLSIERGSRLRGNHSLYFFSRSHYFPIIFRKLNWVQSEFVFQCRIGQNSNCIFPQVIINYIGNIKGGWTNVPLCKANWIVSSNRITSSKFY